MAPYMNLTEQCTFYPCRYSPTEMAHRGWQATNREECHRYMLEHQVACDVIFKFVGSDHESSRLEFDPVTTKKPKCTSDQPVVIAVKSEAPDPAFDHTHKEMQSASGTDTSASSPSDGQFECNDSSTCAPSNNAICTGSSGSVARKLRAHKYMLICKSSVFEDMFSGKFMERNEVTIRDITSDTFMEILK